METGRASITSKPVDDDLAPVKEKIVRGTLNGRYVLGGEKIAATSRVLTVLKRVVIIRL